jgi:hypothetical protein
LQRLANPPWLEKPGLEWLLEITADSSLDMDAFRKAISFPGIEAFAQKDRNFVRTERVQHLLNPGEVEAVGQELLELLNGIVCTECPHYTGVKLKGLIRVFQDHTSCAIAGTPLSVLGLNEVKSMREYIANTTSRASAMDALASSDVDVSEALRLFSMRDDPFMNLYKVFEIIREDVGVDAMAVRFGSSKAQIKRFTRTVNHPGSAGRQSRHARMEGDPVQSPMSSSEARQLMRLILRGWITEKLAAH